MPSPAAPTLDDLISRAGPITAERGLHYFAEGLVSNLDVRADSARAQVRGSTRYQVELRGLGEQFDFSCTCPHAMQGNLCKHVVAVGLAWLDALEPERAEVAIDPDQELRTWLNQQPQAVLADLLFEIAMRDDALQRSLRLKLDLGKRSDDPTDNAEAWYQAIDEATEVEDFLDWRQAASFAADLGELSDALERLLTPEHAALLIELSEYAIPRVEYALQQIDDSSGGLGEVLERLNRLHLQACTLAKPDPIALAERLFDLEMNASFDSFYDSALHYRDVLGNTGLEHFQTLALAEWSPLPRLTAKDQRSNLDSKRLPD
ncbi:MAG TPA: SWIM zinc finger family protein [Pseudomonas sp.]|nr:SWIM zinc finger family protein [Pseudomonas sp.]